MRLSSWSATGTIQKQKTSVKRNKKWLFFILLAYNWPALGQTSNTNTLWTIPQYISSKAQGKQFIITAAGKSSVIYVDPQDWPGVIRAAIDLGDDVRKVCGTASTVVKSTMAPKGAILVGTIGKSKLIDQLITEKKIDVTQVQGKWESFIIQTVGDQLVVAGSDKRGTIYGIYDISEKIGVSPWYWWADAPVAKNSNLFFTAGKYVQGSPKVKYRGIFINDEDPSLGSWARAKFGGVNSAMYAHMFELLLRLKANFLWPAMWGKSFNEDDPKSPALANEYGIVMGTSHHEPMMRAQKEYTDRKNDIGPWDFSSNAEKIKKFWFDGLQRNKSYDNLITIGMRGDGDVAMGNGNDEDNVKTLRQVVKDQRDIIQEVYQKDPSDVPQAWAIFTEVQRYYDAGLTVPDDVTLLFCDNNWGYIRRTGPLNERNRKGGLGMYYHIDMNGGPWNDRWINTTTIPKLREQFNLAYQTGIDREWIVNVGDLKPKEMPIDFIMRYAWDPTKITADDTKAYTVKWAESIFGQTHAEEIADILSKYSKYNLWRKPEVQDTRIFSFVNYNEADRVLKLWQDLVDRAEKLNVLMPDDAKDAYYQLVLYPVKASAGVAEIYLDAGRNNLYAKQGRVSANDFASQARSLFNQDKQLSDYYNGPMADGKWKNMMSDIHIGYQRWSMPRQNTLPELKEVTPLPKPAMGIAVQGSENAWPGSETKAELPVFDQLDNQRYYIDVFNRGTGSFRFIAKADQPWIKISGDQGTVDKEMRLYVTIDWSAMQEGIQTGLIEISQDENRIPIKVSALKKLAPVTCEPFFGGWSGEFSVPASKFSKNIPGQSAKWIPLPDLGRSEACMGIYPANAPSASLQNAPHLEYRIFLPDTGATKICLGILPTQDVNPARGLRIAVAIDEGQPMSIDARKGIVDTFNEYTPANIARSKVLKPLPNPAPDYALVSKRKPRRSEIFDNLRWLDVNLPVKSSGLHTLKVYMVDPEVVLERIIVNPDDKYPSYFGAPEILHNACAGSK